VAAFGRHPTTSKLVWSSIIGYPADYNYREYYRDIGYELSPEYLEPFQYAKGIRTHTGIKYHRITGPTEHKKLYNPDWASESAHKHARDFAYRCADQARRARGGMPFPSVIVSPYDAELFGHWWFEGPQWIYHVFKELAHRHDAIAAGTPSEYLDAFPIQQKATPAPSSWGRKGYNDHWINSKTEWMWRPLHEAAARMRRAVQTNPICSTGSLPDRALRQAGRELMLAQASDWPFIITNGTTEEYARRRFHDHVHRCHYLLEGLERQQLDPDKLAALEQMDALFPQLDYRLFAS
jgi:1,4-alpha-glucan branching enzyme